MYKKINKKEIKGIYSKKLPVWIVVLVLIACSLGGAIISEKNKDEVKGKDNLIISEAVTVKEIKLIGSMNDDDSSTTVVSEDGLSFIISMQINNKDWYEYWIILWNDANKDIDVHLECSLNRNFKTEDNISVVIDTEHYGIRISPQEWAFTVANKNVGIISMNISTDSTVSPGYYQIPFKLTDWRVNAHIENSENPNTNPGDYDNDGVPNYKELGYDKNGTRGDNGGQDNPFDGDADDDGLIYLSEDINNNGIVDPGETDPYNPDTDGDGLNDGLERGLSQPEGKGTGSTWRNDTDPNTKSDPLDPDSDNDGLTDGQEDKNENGKVDLNETNPIDTDTDDDGLTDDSEDKDLDAIIDPTETNPADYDTDNDGLPDGLEEGIVGDTSQSGISQGANKGYRVIYLGTDTSSNNFIVDTDPTTTTDPLDDDTDDDGLIDGKGSIGEDQNKNGNKDLDETDPNVFDTDNDGLGDGQEQGLKSGEGTGTRSGPFVPDSFSLSTTDPLDDDTDDDNIKDGDEDKNHDGHIEGDVNLNFIWDFDEVWLETDPNDSDTDNDSLGDGEELIYEFDPLDPNDPSFDLPKGELEFHKEEITFEYELFDFTVDSGTEIFLGLSNKGNPWGFEVPISIPFGIPWVLSLWGDIKAGFSVEFKLGLEIQAYCKLDFTYERSSWYNINDVKDGGSFNYASVMELKQSTIEFLFSVQPFTWLEVTGWIEAGLRYEVLGKSGDIVKGYWDGTTGFGKENGNDHLINIDFMGDNKIDSTKFTEVLSGENVLGINLFSPIGTLIQTPPMGISFSDYLPYLDVNVGTDEAGINIQLATYAEAGFFFELVSDLKENIKAVIDTAPETVLFESENIYYDLGDFNYRKIDIPDGMSGMDITITTYNFRQVIEPLFRYYYKFGVEGSLGIDLEIPDIELDFGLFEINIPLPDIHEKWHLPDFLLQLEGTRENKKTWGRIELFEILDFDSANKPIITQTTLIHDKVGTAHSHEYDISSYGQDLLGDFGVDGSTDFNIGGTVFELKYNLDLNPHLDLNSKLHTHAEKDTRKSRDIYKYVASMDSDEANDGNFYMNPYYNVELIMDLPEMPNPFAFLNDIDFLDILPDLPETFDPSPITIFQLNYNLFQINYIQVPPPPFSISVPIVPPFIDFEIGLDFFMTNGLGIKPISIEENVLTSPGEWETSPMMHFGITTQISVGIGNFKPFWIEFGNFNIDLILKGKGFYTSDLTFTEESDFWPGKTKTDLKFENPGDYYSCKLYSNFIEGPNEGRTSDSFTARFKNIQYNFKELYVTTRFSGYILFYMHPIKINKDINIYDMSGNVDPLPLENIFDKNSVLIPPFP